MSFLAHFVSGESYPLEAGETAWFYWIVPGPTEAAVMMPLPANIGNIEYSRFGIDNNGDGTTTYWVLVTNVTDHVVDIQLALFQLGIFTGNL
jgi:hypothetical protein